MKMNMVCSLILSCFSLCSFSQDIKDTTPFKADSVFIDASNKSNHVNYIQYLNDQANEALFKSTLVVIKKKKIRYPENKSILQSLINRNLKFNIYTDRKTISRYTKEDSIKVVFFFKKNK